MKDFTKQFEDSRKARPVIIKKEPEPLFEQGFKYVAYMLFDEGLETERLFSLRTSGHTIADVTHKVLKNEKVSEFRVPGGWIGRPVPEGHVTVQESTGFISDEAWSQ